MDDDINVVADAIPNELYRCTERSKNSDRVVEYSMDNMGKWERLLQDKDDSRVWRAIDWKDNFDVSTFGNDKSPSDEAFEEHFETILNPQHTTRSNNVTRNVRIPVLNDLFPQMRFVNRFETLKPDEACGPDGIAPGILNILNQLRW